MDIVNKPGVSMSIVGTYWGLVVFIAASIAFFVYAGFFMPPARPLLGLTTAAVFSLVELVMVLILISVYRTEYVLTDRDLNIRATRLIGGSKRIRLEAIRSVERTLIPFGFRLFGASFYGGYYYLPNIGKTFMVITNFSDGVLIRGEHKNYVITPMNPESFIESIEKMKLREPSRA